MILVNEFWVGIGFVEGDKLKYEFQTFLIRRNREEE